MNLKKVNSLNDLQSKLSNQNPAWVFIYKKGAFASNCGLESVVAAATENPSIDVFLVDVNSVSDVHPAFGISSAPSLFQLRGNKIINLVKGCQSKEYFANLFKNSLFPSDATKYEKTQKSVTVYTSPSCSWCGVVKTHLKQHQISFREIDISRDSGAAQDLFRKSGQMGVPQTEINGEIVVGFNKTRINQLLGIL
ncbi:MAG TPA: thioredoxin family protein [Bacteroidales bacterium]|nr:thioredoxin family protein [Bacteroidales bacterium]